MQAFENATVVISLSNQLCRHDCVQACIHASHIRAPSFAHASGSTCSKCLHADMCLQASFCEFVLAGEANSGKGQEGKKLVLCSLIESKLTTIYALTDVTESPL